MVSRVAVIVLVLGLSRVSMANGVEAGTIDFDIVRADDKHLLLRGEEVIRLEGDVAVKDTVYRDTGGRTVQTETSRFRRDTLELKSYTYENMGTGETVRAENRAGVLEITHRATRAASPENRRLEWRSGMIISKTLGHLAVARLDALRAGKQVDFELVIPSRGEGYRFRMRGESLVAGKPLEVVFEPDSWIVRQFLPRMSFEVASSGAPMVTRFMGPSPVDSPPWQNVAVEIIFRFRPV